MIFLFICWNIFRGDRMNTSKIKIKSKSNRVKNMLPYQNTNLSFEERAADLVSRMTLEEKASQMSNVAAPIQRLGVSVYNYWREGLHGVARQGKATSFPTSLAMSNTWNRDLVYKMADITATEARGKNPKTNLSYWSPTVNLARDPRWGRNEETYGEDPYLTGQLGIAFVNGMQGDDEKYLKTIATVKHFIANNCEKERRNGTSIMDERTLREYYARVFQNIVETANPASAMSSYNATTITRNGEILYDYIPSTANPYILRGLLRRNWGFGGYVTGDCGAFEDLESKPAYKQALFPDEDITKVPQCATVVKAFLAGADTDCGNAATQESVLQAVEQGYISENELTVNVYNLFLQRMRTGEFDIGARYSHIQSDVLEMDEHVAVAEQSAEESWVLLKNENDILPLKKDVKNIALVGPLADEVFLGDYSGSPEKVKKPYYGIYEELKNIHPDAELKYLGGVTDELELFNLESLAFVLEDGSTRVIDLSEAKDVSGLNFDGKTMKDITRVGRAVLPNIDCSNVKYVKAEIATGACLGGSVEISYGKGGSNIARVLSQPTDSLDSYTECVCDYTGNTGGYNKTEDLYLSFNPKEKAFVIDEYREELDRADVIIAYAGTKLDDSKEGEDREFITLPMSQSHVDAITKAYPDKSIVALQTVGQIDVSTFEAGAKAILWTSYNGQTQGTALGKVLTGQANPSGRLTSTWYDPDDLNVLSVKTDGEVGKDGITRYYNDYSIRSGEDFLGRTYQYYKGTPKYPFGYGLSYTSFAYSDINISSDNVDVNESVIVRVRVKNTGICKGAEVVQLYVSTPEADGIEMPKKQLQGFEKVSLMPGEEKTVTFNLNISQLTFFDENQGKIFVPIGTYMVTVSKDACDNGLCKMLHVSGELTYKLKTVCALPSGVVAQGLINDDGGDLEIYSSFEPNLSAVMSDETYYDLSNAGVRYDSADKDIAYVNQDGMVVPGVHEGVTTITASVTVDGTTKSASFPVVNKLYLRAGRENIESSKQLIKSELESYDPQLYSESNRARLQGICDNAYFELENIIKLKDLKFVVDNAISELKNIPMDNFETIYEIRSDNPKIIEHGVIDYRTGGIEPNTNGFKTVTTDTQFSAIQLCAYHNNKKVDHSKIEWRLEKLDNSTRNAASIDSETGQLTIYGNGLIKISAINKSELSQGEIVVYVNMQISPVINGGNTSWSKFDSVKLDRLKQIVVRYESESDEVVINASAEKTTNVDSLLGRTIAKRSDPSSLWNEAVIDVDSMAAINAKKDKNDLGTIYLKSDSAKIASIKLIYDEVNDQVPYQVLSIENEKDGNITINLKYIGSKQNTKAVITASRYTDGKLQGDIKVLDILGSGSYLLTTEAGVGDEIKLLVLESLDSMDILSDKIVHIYDMPIENEVVVYSLSYPAYSTLTSGIDGEVFPEINGLTGYGSLIVKKSEDFTYTYRGKEYVLSNAWQGTAGDESKKCLYFKPKSPCIVTVLYNGNGGNNRVQYIAQSGRKLAAGFSKKGELTIISTIITDTSAPVYTYGDDENKNVYAIIVEYLETEKADYNTDADTPGEEHQDITIQSVSWNGGYARLTEDTLTGETRVSTSARGTVWNDLSTEYFAHSDVRLSENKGFKINCIATYKDRLYAGCDGGLVIVFSTCPKCHLLKKVCADDIKTMHITGDTLTINKDNGELIMPMNSIGGDEIEIDEAMRLFENGAIFVDVRTADEYAKSKSKDSINIPVEHIDEKLSGYDRKTTLIFCCTQGGRSDMALEKARSMGFDKIYNLGNFEKLV